MKLADLEVGKKAVVLSIPGECGSCARLAALGILPGVELRISRVAPLGDPISVEMAGQEFSVRLTEASLIEVEAK